MEVVILSGLSGAGKSQAINSFEDMGYYCIDNMPPNLIKDFIKLISKNKTKVTKIALVMDIRGRDFLDGLLHYKNLLKDKKIDHKLIFLEASKPELLRRFTQTRRVHPLAIGLTIEEAIDKEEGILEPIRDIADLIIDTSELKTSELAAELREFVQSDSEYSRFRFTIKSFGYKFGLPSEVDCVFDMRFIPNPYYVDELRDKTGNDSEVADFVFSHEEARAFAENMLAMTLKLKPYFIKQGKPYMTLAFGCTGGQHRSVAMANLIAERLKFAGESVKLRHKEL
ncbi:MAG: RNase adapter RapZ [Clostridiales Family XIII bacterium]|jgi:UPF0042 nucleotide-binding protein|nr:RNase adapter RapZ [Clostridiales Family XIII bacterium]